MVKRPTEHDAEHSPEPFRSIWNVFRKVGFAPRLPYFNGGAAVFRPDSGRRRLCKNPGAIEGTSCVIPLAQRAGNRAGTGCVCLAEHMLSWHRLRLPRRTHVCALPGHGHGHAATRAAIWVDVTLAAVDAERRTLRGGALAARLKDVVRRHASCRVAPPGTAAAPPR